MGSVDTVAFAKALADETRQKILALCCCQQLSVGDIVAELEVSQPTVSHHLQILKTAGLVSAEKRGKQTLYTSDQEKLAHCCIVVVKVFAPEHAIEEKEED